MGAHSIVDVAVEEGQVHQVLFAALLEDGAPCLVLVLPRFLRVYTISGNGGPPVGVPHMIPKGPEGPLRFLCEMHLGAPPLVCFCYPLQRQGKYE